jgi:hypothetical protein
MLEQLAAAWEWANKNGIVTLVATGLLGIYTKIRADRSAEKFERFKVQNELEAKHAHQVVTGAIIGLYERLNNVHLVFARTVPGLWNPESDRAASIDQLRHEVHELFAFMATGMLGTPQELVNIGGRYAQAAQGFHAYLNSVLVLK